MLLVKKTGAVVGFCYDGDGDRVAVVDEHGEMVGCDLVTALLCQDALSRDPGKICTYDLRSSRVVRDVIEQAVAKAVRIRVGHSHAKQTMRKLVQFAVANFRAIITSSLAISIRSTWIRLGCDGSVPQPAVGYCERRRQSWWLRSRSTSHTGEIKLQRGRQGCMSGNVPASVL